MRQIEMLVQAIARVVFHKDTVKYEIPDETNLRQTDLLYNEIKELIAEKQICDAEDLLFDRMDTQDTSYLELAIDFYQTVNLLDDEELERCNFTRDEISDGLQTVLGMFHLESFIVS